MKKIRLFVATNQLEAGQIIEIIDNDFNYLINVMRHKMGSELLIFNGQNGEYLAKISNIAKKSCQLQVLSLNKKQHFPPKVTLAFALIKNIDFVGQKGTELGVTEFQPLIADHNVVDKINAERFKANIKEAAEQCERLDMPLLKPVIKLESFLKAAVQNKILILCDELFREKEPTRKASEVLSKIKNNDQEIVILVGPEGGFSSQEFERFKTVENLHNISLGPRVLRADTAIVSAITLVQEFLVN